VKDEETFEVRTVKVGAQTDKEAAVTEGLSEGETIVTQGSFILKSELLKSELGEE
jgi:cobalt-zinc-cadmium efflux system membrane fusion protein